MGLREAGLKTWVNSTWTYFTMMSFFMVIFADEMFSASLVLWFHNNVPLGLKSPLALYTAPWNPLFQAIIFVLGPVFPWKKRCDSDSPIGPEAPFPFCNLRPFFTFVPSIGSAYVWFVTSFWVICAAFPHPQLQWRHFPRSPCRNGWVAISTLW